MNRAKDCIDIGVGTPHVEPMLEFWTKEIGLTDDELQKISPGARQHWPVLNRASILNLNCHREKKAYTPASGYKELYVAIPREVDRPLSSNDPDGDLVSLVPYGWQEITRTGMRMTVRPLLDSAKFFKKDLLSEPLTIPE